MKRLLVHILTIVFCCNNVFAQKNNDSVYIQTKVWSRDAKHNIQYSDWKTVGCKTVDLLKGFPTSADIKVDKYGGNAALKFKATHFFYTTLKNNRWWMVDPAGNSFVSVAMNGVRLGNSPNNKKAFENKFAIKDKWMAATKRLMDENGFNTTGSWSDVESIKAYNTTTTTPIVYTTQLSLLSSFSQKQKKRMGDRDYPTLANVFDPSFITFCSGKTKELMGDKDDPNLFGHFSDNELPFQENMISSFMEINDAKDAAYQSVLKYIIDNQIDTANITKEQKERFSGFVANKYYKIMRDAIKANDPNHLYLGSRLHASAKNNPFVLAAVEQYVDVISINYYGNWNVTEAQKMQWEKLQKPFMITEFYTKGEDAKMGNMTGAGWLVKTQNDRGLYYQNFCLALLQINNCVGWHWFRYQDNDPGDKTADPSNSDANKGIVNTSYESYTDLLNKMKQLNINVYNLINYYGQK